MDSNNNISYTSLFSGINLPTKSYFGNNSTANDGVDAHNGVLYNSDQLFLLDVTSRLSSGLSIIAALAVIITFIAWNRFRTPANRLIFFMLVSDIVSSICWFIGRSFNSDFTSCKLQAMILQFGDISSVLWTASMSCNLFMVLFMTKSARDLTQMEKYYFFICYGTAFLIAFIPVFIRLHDGNGIYGKSSFLWCWLKDQNLVDFQLFLYYFPVWIIFVLNTVIYFISSWKVISKTKHMPWRVSGCDSSSSVVSGSIASGFTSLHQQLQQQQPVSHPPRKPSVSYASVRHGGSSYQPAATSVYSGGFSSYAGDMHGFSGIGATRKLGAPSHTTGTQSSASMISLHTLLSFRRRYFIKISLFFLAYLISWSIPSFAKVRSWMNSYESPYIWLWIYSLAIPLRGFINFMCYFVPAVMSCIEERKRDLAKRNGCQ